MGNRIYISGKISNNPNAEADFAEAEKYLWDKGWNTVNPLKVDSKKDTYKSHMKADLKQLKKCDAIYMLVNWKDSWGACYEFLTAQLYDKEIIFQDIDGENYFDDSDFKKIVMQRLNSEKI